MNEYWDGLNYGLTPANEAATAANHFLLVVQCRRAACVRVSHLRSCTGT